MTTEPAPRTTATAAPAPPEGGDEAALLQGLRAGEPSACESLVRGHYGALLATARRILRYEQDARDAVQTALLDALQSIGQLDGTGLGAWLRRRAIRAALDRLRTPGPEEPIEPLLPRFTEDGEHALPAYPWPVSAEADPAPGQLREQVRAAVAQLPESYRVVLVLRDIEELEGAETAALLGLTPQVVKLRLHRARQALRTLLAQTLAH